jgi:hypothetical protein
VIILLFETNPTVGDLVCELFVGNGYEWNVFMGALPHEWD